MLWVAFVRQEISVAKVENCWLQDSYPTVPPATMITHIQVILFACPYRMHRGYAGVRLSPVIEAVGVTRIGDIACYSDCLDHKA